MACLCLLTLLYYWQVWCDYYQCILLSKADIFLGKQSATDSLLFRQNSSILFGLSQYEVGDNNENLIVDVKVDECNAALMVESITSDNNLIALFFDVISSSTLISYIRRFKGYTL